MFPVVERKDVKSRQDETNKSAQQRPDKCLETCLGLIAGDRDLLIRTSTHVEIQKRAVACSYRRYWLKVRLGVLRSYRCN